MTKTVTKFSASECAAIEKAISERMSVRAFLDTPVPRELIERLLDIAARAPSGTNMQPWRAHVVVGAEKDRVTKAVFAHFAETGAQRHDSEYKYYPDQFFEPYLSRRRKVGWDMYGILGIKKGDNAAMAAQHGRNYMFFDAPVGIVFTIDRRLEIGSWLDYGYFLEALSVAARAHGLETCSQAAFAYFHKPVRKALELPDEEMVVCGFSIGYADWSAPINALETERTAANDFATFRGF